MKLKMDQNSRRFIQMQMLMPERLSRNVKIITAMTMLFGGIFAIWGRLQR